MSLKSKRPPRKIHPVVEMEKATKEINLYAMMRSRITRGFDKFFAPMGGSEKIYGRLKNGGDVKISYLLALSKLLGENLLDYYIQRLPENARETVQTRELRQALKEKDDEILQKDSTIIQQNEVIASLRGMLEKALTR